MTSNLKYYKDYNELMQTYQLVLPLSFEGLIPEDDSVRLLSHELEDLHYTKLYQSFSVKSRNPAGCCNDQPPVSERLSDSGRNPQKGSFFLFLSTKSENANGQSESC